MPAPPPACPLCRAPLPAGAGAPVCPRCGARTVETFRTAAATAPVPEAEIAAHRFDFLAPPDHPGDLGRLGGYRVLGVLGYGGMGLVFRAEETRLARQVALKVMLPETAAGPVAKQRFLREAKAAAAVEHDNIVPILHVGEDRGTPFLTMPLLKGQTLADALRVNSRPSVAEVLRIGREIAEGLAAAHATGLIHRDIKPGNVWLEGDRRRVKILDFGLARAAAGGDPADDSGRGFESAGAEALTRTGAVVGTPAYMAPEQARGEAVDARTDLFSLGVVLYQMTTGRLPFAVPMTLAGLAARVIEPPPPPAGLVPGLPAGLSDLILRLLAESPAARPPAARAVADALRPMELAATAAVQVVPLDPVPGGADPWADLGSTVADDTPPVAPPPAARGRPGLVWAAVAAAALAGAGGVAGLFLLTSAPPKGVLAIDAAEADVEVVVKQRGAVVRDRTRDREIVLPPGQYSVELADPRDDLKLRPDRVTLAANGRESVRVAVEKPRPAARPKEAPGFAPDAGTLKALEWVWSVGGEVRTRENERIPPGGTFPGPPTLIDLSQSTPPPTAAGLENLRGTTGLLDLKLTGAVIGDAHVNALAGMPLAKSLTTLRLHYAGVTDAALDTVTRFPSLEWLEFSSVKGLTPAGFAKLRDLPRLKSLIAPDCGLTDAHLAALKGSHLASLFLGGNPAVTADGIAALGDSPEVVHLALNSDRLADDWLPVIARTMPNLGTLSLGGTRVSDAGLPHLAKLRHLTWLNLADTRATATGVRDLAVALPDCGIVWDGGTIGPRDRDRAAAEWLLEHGGQFGYTDATGYRDTARGDKPSDGPFQIITFKLSPAQFTTDADLARFRGLTALGTVVLGRTALTDAGLEHVAAAPKLEKLYVSDCKITSAGLRPLRGCKALAVLHLNGTAVTDEGLDHLAAVPTLREIELGGTGVTGAGVKRLAARLPLCKVSWSGGTIEPKDTNRAAADKLKPHFQTLRLRLGSGPVVEVKSDQPLPAEPFALVGVIDPKKGLPAGFVADTLLPALAGAAGLEEYNDSAITLPWAAAEYARLAALPCAATLVTVRANVPLSGPVADAAARFPAATALGFGAWHSTDADVARLTTLPRVTWLRLDSLNGGGELTAKAWDAVAALAVENLELPGAQRLDGQAFAAIARMKNLKSLHFWKPTFEPGAVRALAPAAKLEKLRFLGECPVADDDLAAFAKMPALRNLELIECPVGDAGLWHLRAAPALVYLDVRGSRVTAAGAKKFAAALPRCKIEYDDGTVGRAEP